MPFFGSPAGLCALLGCALRIAAGLQSASCNPLLVSRQLDSQYYVQWAREIASGDIAGARGLVGGAPFILNPLYAYAIAPLAAAFAEPATAVVIAQALLAGATAALTALAAERFFGRVAAWTAGIAVAFSASLAYLDAHVAVSGLAAFLTAGAVFASAPPRDGSRGHGPVAAGLWLGVGALARPITPLALPFFAWRQWKEGGARRAAVLIAVFAACAVPSLARNWAVAGEPVAYTSASGINFHLGNNAEARKYRGMASTVIRFNPLDMHGDAHALVARELGGSPTASQVSSYFSRMAMEQFVREPAASAAFYANKARWFFSPAEVPSTASRDTDLRFAPLLHLAFVPAWLVASLAIVGIVIHRRRRDVVCGPAAIVLAHLAVLTLVFPLSHYRSPAIPAMAVLAGGAVAAAIAAWRERAKTRVVAIVAGAAAFGVLGALPPQPGSLRHGDLQLLAIVEMNHARWDAAESLLKEAQAAYREAWPDLDDIATPWFMLGDVAAGRGQWEEAIARVSRGLELQPTDSPARLNRSRWERLAGRLDAAEKDARFVLARFPADPMSHMRLGEVLAVAGRIEEAREHLQFALDHGLVPDDEALRRTKLR